MNEKDIKISRLYADMQWRLIKRFIIIAGGLLIIEYFLLTIFNRIWMPFVAHFWNVELDFKNKITMAQLLWLFLILIIRFFIELVASLVPTGFSGIFNGFVMRIEGYEMRYLPDYIRESGLYRLDNLGMRIFFIGIIVTVIIFIIPYVIGAIIFARTTVIEFRKLGESLNQQNLENEKKRNLMLSDIAHDLRTPITTVLGYSKALVDGMVKDKDKQDEYLKAIVAKSVRLNDLIGLLFEYVKLDSEGYKLNREDLDVAELLRENAALMYPDVEGAGMELVVAIPEDTVMANLDRVAFSRVISNLISNAVKHNNRGTKIVVSLKRDYEKTYIFIADTGEKIEDQLARNLFEPFAVGDASRNTKGGTGLGLSIAAKIMKMHDYSLSLWQEDMRLSELTEPDVGEEFEGLADSLVITKAFVITR